MIPIWGKDYIERWLNFSFAALRSSGNIPYLAEHSDFEIALLTQSEDVDFMQALPRFRESMSGIRVRYIAIDEFFPRAGTTSYGVPLTLAYAKGILDLGDAGIGTYVILMNADLVLASGSLVSLLSRIREGCTVIKASSIRAIDGVARLALVNRVDKESGVLEVGRREMMRLANSHLHSTVSARIVNENNMADSTYYHQIFWRISPDCLAMRAFLLHPLCFRVERMAQKVICPVDYGFITEFSSSGQFGVLDDTDDYFMLELQARDSESHWLRVAPRTRTLARKLGLLSEEISAHAATWTTAEHRQSATRTLYYHAEDHPADLGARVAPFEKFVDAILARMPPPVSHIGHFQWLPAIRTYREDMIRGGSPAVPLLDDPRNVGAEA
jgi:hypothetical protein